MKEKNTIRSKIRYEVKYIEYNGEIDDIVFLFDEKYQLLSTFLSCDVTSFEEWIKQDFDRVLSGESEYEEANGNVCCAEISPKTTKIFDNLAEDGEGDWCEVNTAELRELIEEWCEKVREFKANEEKGNIVSQRTPNLHDNGYATI